MNARVLLFAAVVSIVGGARGERAMPARVVCEEPSRLFTGAETPRFQISGGGAWKVVDWRGDVVKGGVAAQNGVVSVEGLSPGYWHLHADGAEPLAFTTTVDPDRRRKVVESPFAADSAFSWMDIAYAFEPSFKADYSAHLVRLIRAAGISQTRERFCWGDVQKEMGGPISWGKYHRNAKLLGESGIKISWMNAGAPKFVGGAGKGWGDHSLARDLVALYDFCGEVGRTFGPYLADFEYLNEPDLLVPAWDAAAQFKAASAGFRSAKSGVPVANFAMCLGVDFTYDNLVFDNDLAKYIDIFNIHNYGRLGEYDAFNARIHRFLEKRGVGDMPILVTESGCEAEGEASLPTDTPRCKAQSPEQEMVVADFIPKAQIKRQFGGVWRNHFFIFASFHERGGRKDWGLVRRDGSARPGVAAFSALTAVLDGAKILGRVDVGPGVEAYLYERGNGSRTLAFWKSGNSPALKLRRTGGDGRIAVQSSSPLLLVDWCGTPRHLPAGMATVAAERHVSYLTGAFDLPIAEPAIPVGRIAGNRATESDEDLETVIRVDFPNGEFDVVDGFTAVETKREGEGRVKVEIWNLSDRAKTGRIYSRGGELVGWPDGDIALPARGVFAHEATLRPLCGKDGEAKWQLRGVFDGRKTSRFTAPVRDFASALRSLRRIGVAANEKGNWQKNTSAPKATFTPEGGAMRIDLSWVGAPPSPDGRWAYNRLRVPEPARNSVKYLVFEIKSEQDKIENRYQCANVFAKGPGRDDRIVCNPPAKDWTKIHVAIPQKVGSPVEWVGLGGNPSGKEVKMWIRNVEFYCAEEPR